jgi:hypothetical protein
MNTDRATPLHYFLAGLLIGLMLVAEKVPV